MAFWSGRRVFLTGHTGFKGSWLALWLADLGAQVTGFALAAPTRPNLFDAARVEDLMVSHRGDIRDQAALAAALRAARPEVVVHMAAQSLVRASYEAPAATYATNVMGTVHVLEAVRELAGVKAVVCVTSDKCYENRETDRGYREDDAMGGYDPYSSSKGCAELVVSAYRRSFFPPESMTSHGVGLATARAGNVIGGGDWARDRLVPDLIAGYLARARPQIRFPASVRPWQHVLDPLWGYLMLARRLWSGDPSVAQGWNFGPGEEEARPVGWIADRVAELWGGDAAWDRAGDGQPHEAASLRLDCSKARESLGWRQRWSLDEALRRTVDWHRALAEGGDARALCLEQVRAYGALVHAENGEVGINPGGGVISLEESLA